MEIPSSVRMIESGALSGCSGLTSATIPAGVTDIALGAFEDCPNLTIYCVKNSAAHTYAVRDNIPFSLGQSDSNNEETSKQSITDAQVTLSQTSYSYDGKAKKPTIKSVKLGNTTLKSGTDYSAVISYKNNKNIGKATAIVELAGKGNYTGRASVSVTFTISAKKGTSFTVSSYKYKITDSQTAAFSGLKSAKTKTVKIPKTVKDGRGIK